MLVYFRFIYLIFFLVTLNANELSKEQSPYLLQHKNNPVNWMAWNDNTLKKAIKEDKLIFLSIGYSTCHWCHVMEEESFEDNEVAKVLNKKYISIKVDREEMPQLDSYYQQIYRLMNGRGGGWPLTIIMTPDKKVFYSGTYMLKENLIERLNNLNSIYLTDKKTIQKITTQVQNALENNSQINNKNIPLELNKVITTFTTSLNNNYDKKFGGFSSAPKFPQATTLEAILDLYLINKDKKLLDKVLDTLKAMANGGIYDQIEGGFYRYSVNRKWEIPHFEKMLYTQAELLKVYSKAYLITKDKFYKDIANEIIFVVNERFKNNNLLYSASDADSLDFKNMKDEGFYFIFEYDETYNFLKKKGYNLQEIYDILKYFHINSELDEEYTIGNPYITDTKVLKNLAQVKKDLKELRSIRKYPFIDNKIQTSWNALYIDGLFTASKFNNQYGIEAITLLDELLKNMYKNDTLYHQKLDNKYLKVKALLEDYSFLITSLIQAHQFSFDTKYLKLATKLATITLKKFYKKNIWYLSDDNFKAKSPLFDSAYKSAQSNMIENLFKLAILTNKREFYNTATSMIKQNSYQIYHTPTNVPSAFNTFIGEQKQYKVLKTTQANLVKNKNKIIQLNNPYLLLKPTDNKQYLACTINSCFSFDNDIEKVLKVIELF